MWSEGRRNSLALGRVPKRFKVVRKKRERNLTWIFGWESRKGRALHPLQLTLQDRKPLAAVSIGQVYTSTAECLLLLICITLQKLLRSSIVTMLLLPSPLQKIMMCIYFIQLITVITKPFRRAAFYGLHSPTAHIVCIQYKL